MMGGSVSAGRWEGPGAPSYISGPLSLRICSSSCIWYICISQFCSSCKSGPLYCGIHNLNIPSIVWCSMPFACEAILCKKSTASIQLFSKVHLNGENCWSGCFRASRPNPRLTIRAACLGPSLLLTYILLPRQPPGYTLAHSCAIFFVIWIVKYPVGLPADYTQGQTLRKPN